MTHMSQFAEVTIQYLYAFSKNILQIRLNRISVLDLDISSLGSYVVVVVWGGGVKRLSLAVGFVELSAAKALKDGRLLSSCIFKVVFRLQSLGNSRPVCHMTAIHC
jgi:hypothetical protein